MNEDYPYGICDLTEGEVYESNRRPGIIFIVRGGILINCNDAETAIFAGERFREKKEKKKWTVWLHVYVTPKGHTGHLILAKAWVEFPGYKDCKLLKSIELASGEY